MPGEASLSLAETPFRHRQRDDLLATEHPLDPGRTLGCRLVYAVRVRDVGVLGLAAAPGPARPRPWQGRAHAEPQHARLASNDRLPVRPKVAT